MHHKSEHKVKLIFFIYELIQDQEKKDIQANATVEKEAAGLISHGYKHEEKYQVAYSAGQNANFNLSHGK